MRHDGSCITNSHSTASIHNTTSFPSYNEKNETKDGNQLSSHCLSLGRSKESCLDHLGDISASKDINVP